MENKRMGRIIDRRRVMGGKNLLPSEYQEVEYIETDGNSYVNLNETATIDCEIGLDCYVAYASGNNQFFMGCRSRRTDCAAIIGIQPMLVYQFGSMSNSVYTKLIEINKRYKIVANNTGCYVDDTLYYPYTGSMSALESTNHIMLFATSQSNDAIGFHAGNGFRVYSAYVKKNNTYVKNVIPCRRKSDNVIGMYDTVTNTFYTNQGRGTFTAGPDV